MAIPRISVHTKPVHDGTSPPLSPLRLDGVVDYPAEFAAQYREKGYWIGQTHSALLDSAVSAHPDRPAVVDPRRTVTYAELSERVQVIAGAFAAEGLGRGDRVIVHMPNTVEYVEVVFALFEIGALPVFALAAHRSAEIHQSAPRQRPAGMSPSTSSVSPRTGTSRPRSIPISPRSRPS